MFRSIFQRLRHFPCLPFIAWFKKNTCDSFQVLQNEFYNSWLYMIHYFLSLGTVVGENYFFLFWTVCVLYLKLYYSCISLYFIYFLIRLPSPGSRAPEGYPYIHCLAQPINGAERLLAEYKFLTTFCLLIIEYKTLRWVSRSCCFLKKLFLL